MSYFGLFPKCDFRTKVLYPTGTDTKGKPVYDRYIPKCCKGEENAILRLRRVCLTQDIQSQKKVLDSFYA